MTKPRTVMIWGQDDLLPKAMEMFLTANHKDTWEVIRIPENQCLFSLAEQVKRVKPDLVIIYRAKAAEDCDPPVKLLQDQPDLRVVTVSLDNNVMQVYSKQSIMVRQVSDLISVIEDRHFSEKPV